MEDKLDALMKMLKESETRMSQEMQAIKLAVNTIRSDPPPVSAFGGVASTPTTCSMGCHPDTNSCVAVVAAPACSISDQDTVFPSTGDPVVELLRGVVLKPISRSAVLQGSSSSASIVKESPEDIHSDSSGFITKVPLSCSTDYRPQHLVAAPVLIASPTEYSIDSNNIPTAASPLARRCEFSSILAPTVHVQRPMPWPSFLSVHADRDEERPLPWPSFKEIKGGQFVNDAIEKVSELCNSNSSCAKVCVQTNGDDTRPLPWPSFMEGEDSETLNKAIMKQLQWCSLDSPRTEGCAAVEIQISDLCIVVRSLELKLLPNGSTSITLLTVSLDSGNCTALGWEYFGLDNIDCVVSWLFAGCLLVQCRKYSAQSSTHYLIERDSVSGLLCTMNCSELKMLGTAADHRIIVAGFPKRQKNSHLLLLSCVWEQEELHRGFQFQLHIILPDWYLGNQSMIARVCPDYSLKYNSFADIWRLWFLCVRSDCATVDTVVLPDGQHSRNWHSAQPGVARDPLLFLIQSAALKYMDFWWFATVFIVNNSAFINLKLLRQSDDIQLRLWPLHIFSPEDKFISKSGIFAPMILPTDCHWGNLTKDQWLYFLLCDIPEADSSILTICELLLLHHQDMIHWQIAWQPCVHACLITIELSHTHNECRCFLCGYQGRPALLLLLEFDQQAVFQGGRHALSPAICYLVHDNDIDFLHSLDSTGLKVMQVPWDPGVAAAAWGQAAF